MLRGKRLTDFMWGGAIVALIAYEVYTLANKEDNDTLSESTWRVTARQPIVPFLSGVLMGHFFWQSSDRYEELRSAEKLLMDEVQRVAEE